MSFFHHQAARLESLFPFLNQQFKAERVTLKPQTPQTIIVGNLDTEAWLQRQFLAHNQIVMGVQFPFIETAIENMSLRLSITSIPEAHESWFTSVTAAREQKSAGMVQLELALAAYIDDEANAQIIKMLGIEISELTPVAKLSLAHNLALKVRDYLLHIPDTMQNFSAVPPNTDANPIHIIWYKITQFLTEHNYHAPLFFPKRLLQSAQRYTVGQSRRSLFLFGMPLLSAYHIQALAALAHIVDVHLMSVIPNRDKVNSTLGLRIAGYENFVEATVKQLGIVYGTIRYEPQSEIAQKIELWKLPGRWRGAEHLADYWHECLLVDTDLMQNDIGLISTNPTKHFAAFDRACGMRQMTLSTHERIYERPQAIVAVLQILAQAAQAGISRTLLLQYWNNPAICDAYGLDKESIQQFVDALERAHGFRNDYPDGQAQFNIDAALQRILRSLLIDSTTAAAEIPGATYLRSFESVELLQKFSTNVTVLQRYVHSLQQVTGRELLSALQNFFSETGLDACLYYEGFSPILQAIQLFELKIQLNFHQLVHFCNQHVTVSPMVQGSSHEGIALSRAGAACFDRKYIVLFDLNEDEEKADAPADLIVAEFNASATRLSHSDQLELTLENARGSSCAQLIYAYSDLDENTGAEKYQSRALEQLKMRMQRENIVLSERSNFNATIFEPKPKNTPPLAADADATTVQTTSATSNHPQQVLDLLKPISATAVDTEYLQNRELENFLIAPTQFLLRTLLPISDLDNGFYRNEPRLAVSSSARFKFCEDYLLSTLRNAQATSASDPIKTLNQQNNNATIAPQGFDHSVPLLKHADNATRLQHFTDSELTDSYLVEYTFAVGLTTPFTVFDGNRLERRYLPAPKVAGKFLTGTLRPLLARRDSNILTDLQSAVYPSFPTAMARAYLTLCLLAATDTTAQVEKIDFVNYTFAGAKDVGESLAPKMTTVATIPMNAVSSPQLYLENLVATMQESKIFWFDLSLFAGKQTLGKFSALEFDAFCEILHSTPQDPNAERAVFLRRYFNLTANTDSHYFFEKFIAPITNSEMAKPSKKSGGAKRNGK